MVQPRKGGKVGGVGRQRVAPIPMPDNAQSVAEVPEDELADLAAETDIEARLREWTERENPERLTVRAYLYKYDSVAGGDGKSLLDRLDDDIPDPHSVGLKYGSGRYMLMVAIPRGNSEAGKVKGLRFRLHARYDDLARAAAGGGGAGQGAAGVTVVNQGNGGGMRDSLELLRSMVEVLAPLLSAQKSAAPDVSAILAGQYDMVSGLMKRQMEDSADLIRKVNEARLGAEPREDEEEEEGFMEKLLPYVEKFLPVLMGGGAGAVTTAAAIKAIPEVQRVLHDAGELRRVVAWLDKTQGQEKTDKILAALRVRRPRAGHNGRVHAAAAPAVAAAG